MTRYVGRKLAAPNCPNTHPSDDFFYFQITPRCRTTPPSHDPTTGPVVEFVGKFA